MIVFAAASAYHSIAVSLLTGTFAIALLFALISSYAARTGRAELLLGSHFTTKAAVILGLALSFAGIITGFLIWPIEAVLNSALLKNKLFVVIMTVLLWAMYLGVVLGKGIAVWYSGPLTLHAVALAVFGFLGNVIANSIGGDSAGNPSGFEQIIRLFGIETRWTFYLPTWMNLALVIAGITVFVVALLISRRPTTPQR